MKLKTLLAAALTAAFALPLASHAAGGKASGGSSDSSAGATKSDDGGAEAMFKALDKDGDGKLSREEHAEADEHQKEKSGTGGSAPGGSKQKY